MFFTIKTNESHCTKVSRDSSYSISYIKLQILQTSITAADRSSRSVRIYCIWLNGGNNWAISYRAWIGAHFNSYSVRSNDLSGIKRPFPDNINMLMWAPVYTPPPLMYKPINKRLRTYISPGLIIGGLRYLVYLQYLVCPHGLSVWQLTFEINEILTLKQLHSLFYLAKQSIKITCQ